MIVNRLLNFLPTTVPGNSLRAATPEEGLQLATRLARATRHNLGEDHGDAPAKVTGYLPPPTPRSPRPRSPRWS